MYSVCLYGMGGEESLETQNPTETGMVLWRLEEGVRRNATHTQTDTTVF